MAAHNLKPSLILLLLASACASTDVQHEPRPVAEAANKASAPGFSAPAADDELAELETSLEAYELQLARNEARLRAMGVLVATRDDNAMAEAEAPSRFAPPPPPMTTPTRKPADLGDSDQNAAGGTRPSEAAKPDARAKDAREQDKTPEKAKKRASRPTPTGGVAKSGTTSASSPAPSSAPRTDPTADTSTRAEAKTEAKTEESRGRCAELCDLADSTCDLEGKICDLAARHPGEARFAEVCRRADEDCRIAAEACTLCSP